MSSAKSYYAKKTANAGVSVNLELHYKSGQDSFSLTGTDTFHARDFIKRTKFDSVETPKFHKDTGWTFKFLGECTSIENRRIVAFDIYTQVAEKALELKLADKRQKYETFLAEVEYARVAHQKERDRMAQVYQTNEEFASVCKDRFITLQVWLKQYLEKNNQVDKSPYGDDGFWVYRGVSSLCPRCSNDMMKIIGSETCPIDDSLTVQKLEECPFCQEHFFMNWR